MGFLKNIGNSIKKNVSLKNIVKIATPLMGAIPIVGGLAQSVTQGIVDKNAAKKAQKEYDAENLKQQAIQAANVLSQSTAQNLSDAVYSGAMQGVSKSTQTATGKAGATVADLTIQEWFKQHWIVVTLGVSGFFTAIWLLTRNRNPQRARRK